MFFLVVFIISYSINQKDNVGIVLAQVQIIHALYNYSSFTTVFCVFNLYMEAVSNVVVL